MARFVCRRPRPNVDLAFTLSYRPGNRTPRYSECQVGGAARLAPHRTKEGIAMMSWLTPNAAPAQASDPDERSLTRFCGATPLDAHFLSRFARMTRLRDADGLDASHRWLLNLALFSTYRDCVALGLRAPARRVLGLADD
jgi:hypothetical protein